MGILDRLNQKPLAASTFRISPHSAAQRNFSYFTEFTFRKGVFYAIVLIYVLSVSFIICVETVVSDHLICDESRITEEQLAAAQLKYNNPSYIYKPCHHIRLPALLWMTRTECNFGRRLLAAAFLGGIVGWERREADRPAGIRTMSLVSLGACLFSINSAYAFLDGPMSWDASRISAAIPSGVGFLGAGLIFKGSCSCFAKVRFCDAQAHLLNFSFMPFSHLPEAEKNESGDTTHVVHGLTTAASLWIVSRFLLFSVILDYSFDQFGTYVSRLHIFFHSTVVVLFKSAAVGTACAGQLYFSATFAIAVILTLLRFGPRQQVQDDEGEDEDYQQEFDMQQHSQRPATSYQSNSVTLDATHPDNLSNEHLDPEAQPLNRSTRRTGATTPAASIASAGAARKRRPHAASLSGML